MRRVPGDGRLPNDVMFVGERPGAEEHRECIPFCGPAGEELWAGVARILGLQRGQVYVTNLVKTFSTKPPSAEEIARDAGLLRVELLRCRPRLIVTIGYHAARYFLPQFRDTVGDYFHGLPFTITYGTLRPRQATLVPCCHSSAALRQPDRYQVQFADDLRAAKRVLDQREEATHARLQPRAPRRVLDLGGFGCEGHVLGCDTEGTDDTGTEAITLAKDGGSAYLWEASTGPVPRFLRRALEANRLTFHQAVADLKALHRVGVRPKHFEDTMLMAYLLGLPQSLKVLAFRELGLTMQEYHDLVAPLDERNVRSVLSLLRVEDNKRAASSIKRILTKPAQESVRTRWRKSKFAPLCSLPPVPTWRDVSEDTRVPYALTDAIAHKRVHELLRPRIKAEGLERIYQIDKAVLPFIVRNEEVGLLCDGARLKELAQQFDKEFRVVCAKIKAKTGQSVNPCSPKQVSKLLYDDLGVTPPGRRSAKTGDYSTEDKYLKARRGEHLVVPLVIEGRQINKMRGTYAERMPDLLRAGRYHPDWRYTRTATGRQAEELITLIPKHSYRGLMIRVCFRAATGNLLVLVDLSQIEMRVMAHLSRDPHLLKAYRDKIDIHAQTAHLMLGAPKRKEDQDDSKHRLPAKTFNFAIINGSTEYGILDQLHEQGQLHWDIEQVREFHRDWFHVHQGVDAYWKDRVREAERTGVLRSMFGRRRRFDALHSTQEQIRRKAERECLWAIQGSADDISKIWNAKIWRQIILPMHAQGIYCEPWVRVHDETGLEVEAGMAVGVMEQMLSLVPQVLSIPVEAEGHTEEAWGIRKLEKMRDKLAA